MKKPSEIFEEHINYLINYVSELKDKSKEIGEQIEECNHKDLESLGLIKHVYDEIFDDLCLLIKNTMKSAMESKINGNNIGDNIIGDE